MSANTSAEADARELAEQLRPALRRLVRQLRRQPSNEPISSLHAPLLMTILENPGIGVGELAQMEGLRSPTMTGHINSMVAAGLVKRTEPSEGDRRRIGLVVTPHGHTLIDAKRKRRTDQLTRALTRLSPDSRAALWAAIPALNDVELEEIDA
ncbi:MULTISPECIES: MarR family winged helix-turn-helix transcriptional regulator [Dyella]|uniref:MarR family winged helix-turn-helix transcriptional regulator n=1 Tax=Dyella TaxID=231454 RepID=UPI000C82B4F2|nr:MULTISPECIES: MarR family winged helix-turn-helix transcriptional regulator [Dyella]MDR3447884.1 MarR family winged helix-turn-helix transcriptional regulator [Dyella sp.]PMQ03428.1 putative HTH-type transcriptional regulator [Dyella sp. AD56]ULU24156.1 MarR family winged helix-turn-helix transcriptional regulator [Dyella terrae]